MRYVKLGRSGLDVSTLCLGCMSFGEPNRGAHEWTLGEDASRTVIRHALERGVNFFDTANVYSDGSSEEIVGRALRDFARREDVVVATKVQGAMRPGPNGGGLSRKTIMFEVEQSLTRLQTDYVDLYQIHRWDSDTPIEETLEALNDVVKAGKARYLGASSMLAWQFSKALYTADARGLARFISMQNHYNLLTREEEREMFPLCADQGIGMLPWSPLARGRLAREDEQSSSRAEADDYARALYDPRGVEREVRAAVGVIAEQRAVPRAQIALAWVAHNPQVTAPIVGGSRTSHIDDAIAGLELELSMEELESLERASRGPVVRSY